MTSGFKIRKPSKVSFGFVGPVPTAKVEWSSGRNKPQPAKRRRR